MYIGEVAEWSKALVLKTRDPLRGPWVRIPPSPQQNNEPSVDTLGSLFCCGVF